MLAKVTAKNQLTLPKSIKLAPEEQLELLADYLPC